MPRTLHCALRAALIALAFYVTMTAMTAAQTVRRALPLQTERRIVPPLLDDAELHDVHFVSERRGWAVGDRGVIWRTDDGGGSWQLLASGVDCPLRSVCFLTDRVGWIVGGGITPHVRTTFGVVLGTTDGGDTWTLLADRNLPLLHVVQFFDLEQGTAVCESNNRFPSGVVKTSDGGKTWQPLPGPADGRWRTGAFVDDDMGVVAGRLGGFTSVGGGHVSPALAGAAGLRGVADVALQPDGRGWLAGEGGLVLTSDNGGVSWRSPEAELPKQLRDAMDFRAVAARGTHVWLAGLPGSVVWLSTDNGRTWSTSPTGSPTPITALHFASETHGWAVGALGRILATRDGGRSWVAVRGGGRRAAVLAIHAHESRVSLNLVTKYGGEEGYRTAVTLMARRDIGPDAEAGQTLDLRLQEAVVAAGGAGASVDWAFPVAAPELDHHPRELIREWQLLTDNRLREVMLSRLVVQLRTWRPDVLILDEPPADDATTKLLTDAVKLAVQQGANDEYEELEVLLHLPPWQVKRAFHRLPDGSAGTVAIDAFEVLPRQGASVSMASAEALGRLGSPNVTAGRREAYAPLRWDGLADEPAGRDFFAGLVLAPGGDARRALAAFDDRDLERQQSLADQQRNFAAYTSRMLDDERHAAQLIGQTKDILGGAPPEQAAVQLANLADEYRRRGQWEHAQTTLFELAERYPRQPAALDALRWLFHFTASAEVSWQRLRASSGAQRSQFRVDGNIVQAGVREAIERARSGAARDDETDRRPAEIQRTSAEAALQFAGGIDQRAAKLKQWQQQAVRLAETMERVNSAYYAEPSIQFPLAALERKRKHPRRADEVVLGFLSATADGPWNRIAAAETWIVQPTTAAPGLVALCHRTKEAPYLDGRLDEMCWQQAIEAPLRTAGEHQRAGSFHDVAEDAGRAVVRLAYDDGFLYIAAQLPRPSGVATVPVELPGRTDDADLSGQDRLSLQLDVDRDYATFYRFDVDQRGWTSDACWENDAWNAERFIAVDADTSAWRLEMAIPFADLVAEPPRSGDTWAAGIVRVIPTVGVESWTRDAGTQPQPQGFGLLRFE